MKLQSRLTSIAERSADTVCLLSLSDKSMVKELKKKIRKINYILNS